MLKLKLLINLPTVLVNSSRCLVLVPRMRFQREVMMMQQQRKKITGKSSFSRLKIKMSQKCLGDLSSKTCLKQMTHFFLLVDRLATLYGLGRNQAKRKEQRLCLLLLLQGMNGPRVKGLPVSSKEPKQQFSSSSSVTGMKLRIHLQDLGVPMPLDPLLSGILRIFI